MRIRNFISLWLVVAFGVSNLFAAASMAQTQETVQGRLSQISRQQLTIEVRQGEYKEFKFDISKAKCFDFRRDPTTCETLIGVGYADKARITLVGGVIQRVDILELQQ